MSITHYEMKRVPGNRALFVARLMSHPHALVLVAIILIEAVVFYLHTVKFITPYYPRNFDQTSYFDYTYRLAESTRHNGWGILANEYFHPTSAPGITLVVQGAIIALLFGPNRTALLSLNLGYFIALQLVLFYSVRAVTRSFGTAWTALTLLFATGTVFLDAGGIYDYRLDFAAQCLFGIWVCLVLWSRVFRDLKTSIVIAATGILLVTVRLFSVTYVSLVLGELLLISLVVMVLGRSATARVIAKERAINIFLSGTLTALVVCALLFAARQALYDYYGVTHIITNEKYIRAAELQLYTVLDHVLFYPRNILEFHLGSRFGIIAAAAFVAGAIGTGMSLHRFRSQLQRYRPHFIALGCCIVTPIGILTFDISKSPVVGGVVVTPIVLAVTLLIHAATAREHVDIFHGFLDWVSGLVPSFKRNEETSTHISQASNLTAIQAILTIALAIAAFVSFVAAGSSTAGIVSRTDQENISNLNERVARYAVESGNSHPKVSFDRVVDYLNRGTISVYGFERFDRLIDFQPRFGHGEYGIFATPREVALKLVEDSDIIVLTDPVLGRSAPYPINTKIREYWDELWNWAKENCTEIYSIKIFGVPHHVFLRTSATPRG